MNKQINKKLSPFLILIAFAITGCESSIFTVVFSPTKHIYPTPLVEIPEASKNIKKAYDKQWHIKKMTGQEGISISKGNSKLKIAILSTGVDYNHPELIGKVYFNEAESSVLEKFKNHNSPSAMDKKDNDKNGLVDDFIGYDVVQGDGFAYDRQGYGTALAGLITSNNLSIAPMIENVQIIPIQYITDEGTTSLSLLIEGLNAAAAYKPDVVLVHSLSFSEPSLLSVAEAQSKYGKEYSDKLKALHFRLKTALKKLEDSLLVLPAGNSYRNFGDYALEKFFKSLDNSIVVTALPHPQSNKSQNNVLMYSSNTSRNFVDLAAPGEDLYTLKSGGGYRTISGTAAASALVAATATAYMGDDFCGELATKKERLECVTGKLKSFQSMNHLELLETSVKNGLYLGLKDFLKK